MSQQPFLKSIHPVNLLSFGPNTEEIELRPLNILIGPNGCGKSNLIEIVGLLSKLPDKDPWSTVIETGGAFEWIWKGKNAGKKPSSLSVTCTGHSYPVDLPGSNPGFIDSSTWTEKPIFYEVELKERESSFEIAKERFQELDRMDGDSIETPWFERKGWVGRVHSTTLSQDSPEQFSNLPVQRSVLSMLGAANASGRLFHIQKFADDIEKFSFYRDWVFGVDSNPRDPQPVGLSSTGLEEDSRNLAQVLKAWRDRGEQAVFDRLVDSMRQFYEPVRDVDAELVGTHIRVIIKESAGFSTPAIRLSDGTLRWLSLLIILLNPSPPAVTCIEEPELGLHPDMIPALADLIRDASTRTQLILTTHSRDLVECFSDEPQSVCVCEKIEGETHVLRLNEERLKVWLKDYSLGQLWASGEIGGNRW